METTWCDYLRLIDWQSYSVIISCKESLIWQLLQRLTECNYVVLRNGESDTCVLTHSRPVFIACFVEGTSDVNALENPKAQHPVGGQLLVGHLVPVES